MAPRSNRALPTGTADRSTSRTGLSRRRLLRTGAAAAALLAAGCLDEGADGSSSGDDGGDEDADGDGNDESESEEPGSEESEDDVREALFALIDAYAEAAAESDTEAMSDLTHSASPFDPVAWEEDGWEFRGGDGDATLEEDDIEVVSADASIDDLYELEGADFWFDRAELEDGLGGERLALVDIDAQDPADDGGRWALATEDGEWRYLFAAAADDTPDDPEEAFEEPIEDEENAVVEEIDWEYDSPTSDVEQAAVVLTDSRGIEANRIRVESTIAGGRMEVYDKEDGEFSATWTGMTVYVQFDPDGDQIVVTAIDGDEETVVHREHFEP